MVKTSFINKYSPNKIKDIIGQNRVIDGIVSWLKSYENYKKLKLYKKVKKVGKRIKKNDVHGSILVSGKSGYGKSTIVKTIVKELGYEIVLFNPSESRMKKKGKNKSNNYFNYLSNTKNVSDILSNSKRNKKCILIDGLESISSTTDKSNILTLIKENEQKFSTPIILITDGKHNKLLSDIRKLIDEIFIYPLKNFQIKKIVNNICLKEKINVVSEDVVLKIIEHSQYDIRNLINILQDLKTAFNNNPITSKGLNDFLKSSMKKDVDQDLYNATNGLMTNYSSIDECLKYYETEKVLFPLMVHENNVRYIYYNIDSEEEQLEVSSNIAKVLSEGDLVENYIYCDQNWDLQELHGFYTCAVPSHYYNKSKGKYSEKIRPQFPQDLNKTSIKKINKKNIDKTNKCLQNMKINDFININRIIKYLLKNNNIEECVRLLKPYNINKEQIESLLKIDKIDTDKVILTSKQKKKFASLL